MSRYTPGRTFPPAQIPAFLYYTVIAVCTQEGVGASGRLRVAGCGYYQGGQVYEAGWGPPRLVVFATLLLTDLMDCGE